jgi:hypothetical protein
MTLTQATKKFKVAGLDTALLKNQDEAFQHCLTFLEGIEKIRTLNRRGDSFKHIVEKIYDVYVYEGTFILAALASGFKAQPIGSGLKSWFNFSQPSIRRRVLELARK